jgi:hypothetical protein
MEVDKTGVPTYLVGSADDSGFISYSWDSKACTLTINSDPSKEVFYIVYVHTIASPSVEVPTITITTQDSSVPTYSKSSRTQNLKYVYFYATARMLGTNTGYVLQLDTTGTYSDLDLSITAYTRSEL